MARITNQFMQQVLQRQRHRRRQYMVDKQEQESQEQVDLTKPIWLPNNPDPQGLRKNNRNE